MSQQKEIWKVDTKPEIVYENNNIVVINKPWGLIAHPKNTSDNSYSVTQWFKEKYPESSKVGEDLSRPGLVHRLDRETSGIMVLAKNQKSFIFLKNQFRDRDIKKQYLALVIGHPKEKSGVIDSPLGRIGIKRTTRIKGNRMLDKKEALTEYKVLKKFNNYTLLDVSPKTGRTHQIRVHLKSIGLPIAGDTVYGNRPKDPEDLSRLFLHAWKLELRSPNGEILRLECDLPEDLTNVLDNLEK